MSERREAQARSRSREQGEAKERSSRLRARMAADGTTQRNCTDSREAARPRAIARGRLVSVARFDDLAEAAA